jgi:hypothetical protein
VLGDVGVSIARHTRGGKDFRRPICQLLYRAEETRLAIGVVGDVTGCQRYADRMTTGSRSPDIGGSSVTAGGDPLVTAAAGGLAGTATGPEPSLFAVVNRATRVGATTLVNIVATIPADCFEFLTAISFPSVEPTETGRILSKGGNGRAASCNNRVAKCLSRVRSIGLCGSRNLVVPRCC